MGNNLPWATSILGEKTVYLFLSHIFIDDRAI